MTWLKDIAFGSGNNGGGATIKNQDKTITENGTYAADEGFTGLGKVTVNVAASGGGQETLDLLINRDIVEVRSETEEIGTHAFDGCKSLTDADFPLSTYVGTYAFAGCSSLVNINLPLVTEIPEYCFDRCKSIIVANFANVTVISQYGFNECNGLETADFQNANSIGKYAFYKCTSLKNIDFPKITVLTQHSFGYCENLITIKLPKVVTVEGYSARYCTNLKIVDLPAVTKIETQAFSNGGLTHLVIRTDSVCTLANKAAFTSTPIASSAGYIYVPSALIEDYKVATNWSTYAAQFRALEDYTVDGTVTGELDETKI